MFDPVSKILRRALIVLRLSNQILHYLSNPFVIQNLPIKPISIQIAENTAFFWKLYVLLNRSSTCIGKCIFNNRIIHDP